MKRTVFLFMILALLASCLSGCISPADLQTGPNSELSGEVLVFAAASLSETLTELGSRFTAANPRVKLTFNFASSGKLMDQIAAGADCDLFISAAPKQMNALELSQDGEKNPNRQDFIDPATRLDLLENRVALAVPPGNPKNVHSYRDLVQGLRNGTMLLAMGGEGVPVGQYTQKLFAYFGLEEAALAEAGVLTYGEDVKAVTTLVSEGLADCGIIYQTDAHSAGLAVVDTATEAMCGQVIYPAALLKAAPNPEAARAFLAFLQTPEAAAVFEAVGFTPLTHN